MLPRSLRWDRKANIILIGAVSNKDRRDGKTLGAFRCAVFLGERVETYGLGTAVRGAAIVGLSFT